MICIIAFFHPDYRWKRKIPNLHGKCENQKLKNMHFFWMHFKSNVCFPKCKIVACFRDSVLYAMIWATFFSLLCHPFMMFLKIKATRQYHFFLLHYCKGYKTYPKVIHYVKEIKKFASIGPFVCFFDRKVTEWWMFPRL